jgi:hypothetical protein
MRRSRQFVIAMSLIVAGTITGLIAAPGRRPLVVSIGVMAALALMLVEMGRAARSLAGKEGSAWARVRATPALAENRPSDLEQLERVLGWGRYSLGDFNFEARPLLRRLVAQRLLVAHGVDIDARPEAARPIVSSELFDLLVAKQPVEVPRVIRTDDIVRMVDEIEGI